MLFNSIQYFLFLTTVFVLYYLLPDKFRWILLLTASIFFYMIGGAVLIIVPVIITVSTFYCGIGMQNSSVQSLKNRYFLLGLSINLGLLVFYKYINFFLITSFDGFYFIYSLIGSSELSQSPIILQFVVPLGISFITFQAIGYLIEISRGNQQPERNLVLFSTYLLFFPKILSGPIERVSHFIPQLRKTHSFNYEQIVSGLKRILWGVFLKLVVANRLTLFTDVAFNNYEHHTGITLLVATIFFTVQLFADFAGYTAIAIGSAEILGYKLMENFDSPFIAKSVTEFWRRWHISLTSWVNEYIYNPIVVKYRNWNKGAIVFACIVTFLILGLWHGASWNFILFGFLHGIILSLEFLTRKFRKRIRSNIPDWLNTILGTSFTFLYFSFTLIFFKARDAKAAFSIVEKICIFRGPLYFESLTMMIYSLFGILFITAIGVINLYYPDQFSFFNNKSLIVRYFSYVSILFMILLLGVFDGGQFIYFQF